MHFHLSTLKDICFLEGPNLILNILAFKVLEKIKTSVILDNALTSLYGCHECILLKSADPHYDLFGNNERNKAESHKASLRPFSTVSLFSICFYIGLPQRNEGTHKNLSEVHR